MATANTAGPAASPSAFSGGNCTCRRPPRHPRTTYRDAIQLDEADLIGSPQPVSAENRQSPFIEGGRTCAGVDSRPSRSSGSLRTRRRHHGGEFGSLGRCQFGAVLPLAGLSLRFYQCRQRAWVMIGRTPGADRMSSLGTCHVSSIMVFCADLQLTKGESSVVGTMSGLSMAATNGSGARGRGAAVPAHCGVR